MSLASISIRRPTFIFSIVAVMLVVGLACLRGLPVDQFPDITFPVISVTTPYRGAGPEELETLVSKPLEEELSALSGLRHVSSINQDNLSVVITEFALGTDIKYAEQQVRDRLALVRPKFPHDVDEPVVRRFEVSDQPIVRLALSADLKPADLFDLADEVVKPRLQQVANVGSVKLVGGTKREILVSLDRDRLRDARLSVTGVAGRLAANSQNVPVGRVTGPEKDLLFRTLGEYRSLDRIRGTVVNFFGSDVPVTVADLGTVEETISERQAYAFLNNEPALFLDVYRQSGSNVAEVAEEVIRRAEHMGASLKARPGAPTIRLVRNDARYIRWNLDDVTLAISLGIVLTILVVYLFLGNVRSTFITSMALPNSIIGTFILMYVMGFTINVITLLALSLAVGLLVDDAIVVRENIWRHLEMGESPKQAAIDGTHEVTLAVVATTLTVISVFLPIGFLKGTVGQFFKQLGLTVVFAMSISLFDAMAMAPLLSAYLAKRKPVAGGESPARLRFGMALLSAVDLPLRFLAAAFDRLQDRLTSLYGRVIRAAIPHPGRIALATAIIVAGSGALLKRIPKTFLPTADIGFYQVVLEAPPGTSLEAMLRRSREVSRIIQSHPENSTIALQVGNESESNVASFFVEMVHWRKRRLTTTEMKQKLREELAVHADLNPQVGDVQAVGNLRPFMMNMVGEDLDVLVKAAETARTSFARIHGLADVSLNYKPGKPEFQVAMIPEKMKRLGVSAVTAGLELRAMVDGVVPAKYREGGREVDVRVRLQEDQRDLKRTFNAVSVPNLNQSLVRLADAADPRDAESPSKIFRRDRARYVQVSGDLGPGGALGDILGEAKRIMNGLALPAGVTYEFVGQAEDLAELMRNMLIAMALAVIFMYLILASLYESLVMPFLIMLALPLGLVGAFAGLYVTHQSLSIFSMIALVMLLGLVAKNSILLVDYAIRLMRQGLSREEALVKAGTIRLRPILMTTVALIAGMLPLALGLTEVGRFRRSMGIAVISGLVSSTLLSLVVIPALFGWFDRFRRWSRRVLGRPPEREIDQSPSSP